MTEKLKGLFINCIEAKDSIFESGKMVYGCLKDAGRYSLDYVEIDPDNLAISTDYDFYFFNYHMVTMSWLDTGSIRSRLPGVKMTMVLEVAPNDPFVYCSPDDFDVYCVLDPTLNIDRENVFSFPRPLETYVKQTSPEQPKVPVIGSFGFATPGKGFELLIDAVNREFEWATVRINIPFGTYTDEGGEYAHYLAKACRELAKKGIEVIVTHDFMSKDELILWCGENTINCFLYDRNMPGLAATTDQAIASGRPLLISKNNTFRHIQKFIKPFPYQSLQEAIANTGTIVEEIQRAWSPEMFRERFYGVLDLLRIDTAPDKAAGNVDLRLRPVKRVTVIDNLKEKVHLRTRLKRLAGMVGLVEDDSIKPDSKATYSQFGEDVIVRDLLEKLSIQNFSYLDIGANNPKFISNTYLFYERGSTGVLVEPNPHLCEKLKSLRPRDTVLNVGIGFDDSIGEADFYLFPDEADGLSTFSVEEAKFWENVKLGGKNYKAKEVIQVPLMNINHVITKYFTECPDFISIDVEGWDLKILKSLDFEIYSPAIFCVETLAYKTDGSTYRNLSVQDFLETKGYFPYKETYANTIFLNRNLYEFDLYLENAKKGGSI